MAYVAGQGQRVLLRGLKQGNTPDSAALEAHSITEFNSNETYQTGNIIYVRDTVNNSISIYYSTADNVAGTTPGTDGNWSEINTEGGQGEIGPRGTQGTKGEIGPRGNAGSDGNIGPKGEQGSQGEIGPRGTQGLEGTHGSIGPRGLDGQDGAVGPKGDQGEQGSIGPRGLDGSANLIQTVIEDDTTSAVSSAALFDEFAINTNLINEVESRVAITQEALHLSTLTAITLQQSSAQAALGFPNLTLDPGHYHLSIRSLGTPQVQSGDLANAPDNFQIFASGPNSYSQTFNIAIRDDGTLDDEIAFEITEAGIYNFNYLTGAGTGDFTLRYETPVIEIGIVSEISPVVRAALIERLGIRDEIGSFSVDPAVADLSNGDIWYNTTDDVFKIFNGDVEILATRSDIADSGGNLGQTYRSTSAGFDLTDLSDNTVYEFTRSVNLTDLGEITPNNQNTYDRRAITNSGNLLIEDFLKHDNRHTATFSYTPDLTLTDTSTGPITSEDYIGFFNAGATITDDEAVLIKVAQVHTDPDDSTLNLVTLGFTDEQLATFRTATNHTTAAVDSNFVWSDTEYEVFVYRVNRATEQVNFNVGINDTNGNRFVTTQDLTDQLPAIISQGTAFGNTIVGVDNTDISPDTANSSSLSIELAAGQNRITFSADDRNLPTTAQLPDSFFVQFTRVVNGVETSDRFSVETPIVNGGSDASINFDDIVDVENAGTYNLSFYANGGTPATSYLLTFTDFIIDVRYLSFDRELVRESLGITANEEAIAANEEAITDATDQTTFTNGARSFTFTNHEGTYTHNNTTHASELAEFEDHEHTDFTVGTQVTNLSVGDFTYQVGAINSDGLRTLTIGVTSTTGLHTDQYISLFPSTGPVTLASQTLRTKINQVVEIFSGRALVVGLITPAEFTAMGIGTLNADTGITRYPNTTFRTYHTDIADVVDGLQSTTDLYNQNGNLYTSVDTVENIPDGFEINSGSDNGNFVHHNTIHATQLDEFDLHQGSTLTDPVNIPLTTFATLHAMEISVNPDVHGNHKLTIISSDRDPALGHTHRDNYLEIFNEGSTVSVLRVKLDSSALIGNGYELNAHISTGQLNDLRSGLVPLLTEGGVQDGDNYVWDHDDIDVAYVRRQFATDGIQLNSDLYDSDGNLLSWVNSLAMVTPGGVYQMARDDESSFTLVDTITTVNQYTIPANNWIGGFDVILYEDSVGWLIGGEFGNGGTQFTIDPIRLNRFI